MLRFIELVSVVRSKRNPSKVLEIELGAAVATVVIEERPKKTVSAVRMARSLRVIFLTLTYRMVTIARQRKAR